MTESAERLVKDLVPAEVQLPDGTRYLRARAFVTTERILVYTEGRPANLVYEQTVDGADPAATSSAGTPQRIATADGEVFMRRARHTCTCQLPGLMALSWPV